MTDHTTSSSLSIPESISNIAEVKDFAKLLREGLSINFHPDDPFIDFLNDKALAARLDTLMDQCFEVCDAAGADIYEVMGYQI